MPVASYKAENNASILIEIESPQRSGRKLVSKRKDGVIEAQSSFEEAIDGIKPIADQFAKTVASLAKKPKETEVTFGIKFTGEVGIILASSSLEASLQVKLKW
ncbi:hypothetical protein IWQ55_001341 [Labrenzia sp. EL_208]|nr:hypothetical protein [Labrenzia sp. EL_132]MBG6228143.1 hypothetical protein [Labrenzia sp. EL_208]